MTLKYQKELLKTVQTQPKNNSKPKKITKNSSKFGEKITKEQLQIRQRKLPKNSSQFSEKITKN